MPSTSAATKGPTSPAEPPDRDDDQEIDHELERKRRIEAEDLGAERAAESRKA
jgi:hypothetical protein